MEDFIITGFKFFDRESRDLPGFLLVNYDINVPGEIESTHHNIEGKVRITPNWPETPEQLEKTAKAEIKRVLQKAAAML